MLQLEEEKNLKEKSVAVKVYFCGILQTKTKTCRLNTVVFFIVYISQLCGLN